MSSIIIYGPRVCGKTHNGEALRNFFGMDLIVDCGKIACDPYPHTPKQEELFKSRNALYLTDVPPPKKYLEEGTRRIMDFYFAMNLAGLTPLGDLK